MELRKLRYNESLYIWKIKNKKYFMRNYSYFNVQATDCVHVDYILHSWCICIFLLYIYILYIYYIVACTFFELTDSNAWNIPRGSNPAKPVYIICSWVSLSSFPMWSLALLQRLLECLNDLLLIIFTLKFINCIINWSLCTGLSDSPLPISHFYQIFLTVESSNQPEKENWPESDPIHAVTRDKLQELQLIPE